MFSPPDPLARLGSQQPVVLAADPVASLRSRGHALAADADVGELVRRESGALGDVYADEIGAGADVLVTLTADTTPRSLGRLGMAFRAAALSAVAVDEAHAAVSRSHRSVLVAGVLGPSVPLPADEGRIDEELGAHAARLATAGCQILLARAGAVVGESADLRRRAHWTAVLSARATGRATWAVIGVRSDGEPADGGRLAELAPRLVDEGVAALLFDGDEEGLTRALERAARHAPNMALGAFVGAQTISLGAAEERLVGLVNRLWSAGARVLGSGAGCTTSHTRRLAAALHQR